MNLQEMPAFKKTTKEKESDMRLDHARLLQSVRPLTLVLSAAASFGALSAQASPDFSDFFEGGKFIIDARYRFESVSQDGFAKDAAAHTVRLRAGYQTAKVWDLQFLLEGEGILQLNDSFNDTVNGHTAYPIVADPEDAQINRLQLEYSGLPQTVITVGRQRLNFDNQRFVGGVAFRQNEQTFDAARITNTSIEDLSLTYVYVTQVNRIFGEDSTQGAYEGSTHLVNASYDIRQWGKLSAYAYLLNFDDAATQSSATFGMRFAGRHDVAEGVSALYSLEYATQHDYENSPSQFDLSYWAAEAGLATHGFRLLAGRESLEGNGTRGFATPLATLHKFQGYADVFLTTPGNGIVDTYATLGYETKLEGTAPFTGLTAAVTWHAFDAERGNTSFGNEMDYEISGKMGDHWSIGVKYADYQGDSAVADRDKLWLSVDFSY